MSREHPKISVILPILIKEEWQKHMTECCIKIMRSTTSVPFELVIVETGSSEFKNWSDKYIHFENKTTLVKDTNAGIDAASGDYLVQIGNDIFTKPDWLEAMLECFQIKDCGAATLASSDMKCLPTPRIMEGMYGPLMMFKKGWKFDEDYSGVFSDADLVMRIYEAGMRSYRNWRVLIGHLYQQTFTSIMSKEEMDAKFEEGKRMFIGKHNKSQLLTYRALVEGWKW